MKNYLIAVKDILTDVWHAFFLPIIEHIVYEYINLRLIPYVQNSKFCRWYSRRRTLKMIKSLHKEHHTKMIEYIDSSESE